MNERTVVAWDGTPEALAALEWAVSRERSRRGEVVLVAVVHDALLEAISDDETTGAIEAALQSLDDQVVRLARSKADVQISTQLVRGDPKHVLERFSSPTSVVVLGSHDSTIREPLFARSLTSRLISEAEGPLVIVPSTGVPAGDGVIVGVDDSSESKAAVWFAAEEAERTHTSLTLVHAWLEPVPITIVGDIAAADLPWSEPSHRDLLEQQADRIRVRLPGLVVQSILEQGSIAETLVRHARSASLLVLGTRGYGPVLSALLGSVTRALVRATPCPIAVAGPGYARALRGLLPLSTTARS